MNISVIIPIYNVEKYILSCLLSVSNQSMTEEVECILVDDCGTDNSVGLAEEFIAEYSGCIEFSFLHHDKNKGLSAARNTGIKAAKGKYIFFLDSDDEITNDCLENMYVLAEAYDADMVQGCYIADVAMLTNFSSSLPDFTDDKGYIKRLILDYDHFPVMAQNRLVKRYLIADNNIYFKDGIIHEDNHWTFFLAKYINRLAVCKTPSYIYRTTPGSITSEKNIIKESFACKTYISDFCENIDSFDEGAQKRLIFLNLLSMWRGQLYSSRKDAQKLVSLFMSKNGLVERLLIWYSLHMTFSKFLNGKCVNLLQRIYLFHQ